MEIQLSAKCLSNMLKHVQGPEFEKKNSKKVSERAGSLGFSQYMAVILKSNIMIHKTSGFYSV